MVDINLGNVKGDDGEKGNGIRSIVKTGTSGLVDTYTVTYDNWDTDTIEVTNGKDGSADIVTSWESTLSDVKVASEKLTKNTIDTKLSSNQGSGNAGKYLKIDVDGSVVPATGGGVDIVTSWESTLSDTKVPSEKLTKNTIDGKVDKETGKGLSENDFTTTLKNKLDGIEAQANKTTVDATLNSSSTNPLQNKAIYTALAGKVDVAIGKGLSTNDFTNAFMDKLDGIASGAEVNVNADWNSSSGDSQILNKPSIPSSSSDLSDGSDIIKKSNTSGLIKNDGTVDTVAKLTSSDIVDNLTTSDATKVLSAKQGKALADLIGDAITYINQ